jgi:MYXO-CTERM domain-containing protein
MRRRASLTVGAALAAMVVGEQPSGAAVEVDTVLQESVFDQAELETPNLTVGSGADLLIVVVASSRPEVVSRQITWKSQALRPVDARSVSVCGASCRLEVWTLVDPEPGTNTLLVSRSASVGFGLGAVSYTGVDRQAPLAQLLWETGAGAPVGLDLPVPGERPVLGAACLGGAWTTGPTLATPELQPGPDEIDFWNFTEPGVVGVGSHRLAMNGRVRVSWNLIGGTDPFQWLAVAVPIKPAGEVLVDGGADGAADAISSPDADHAADRGIGEPVAPEDAGAGDGSGPDVRLRVGCACRVGGRNDAPVAVLLVALGVVAPRRRRC